MYICIHMCIYMYIYIYICMIVSVSCCVNRPPKILDTWGGGQCAWAQADIAQNTCQSNQKKGNFGDLGAMVYSALHCTELGYTTLHYTTLHYTTLHHTTLHYITLHFTTLHSVCIYIYIEYIIIYPPTPRRGCHQAAESTV